MGGGEGDLDEILQKLENQSYPISEVFISEKLFAELPGDRLSKLNLRSLPQRLEPFALGHLLPVINQSDAEYIWLIGESEDIASSDSLQILASRVDLTDADLAVGNSTATFLQAHSAIPKTWNDDTDLMSTFAELPRLYTVRQLPDLLKLRPVLSSLLFTKDFLASLCSENSEAAFSPGSWLWYLAIASCERIAVEKNPVAIQKFKVHSDGLSVEGLHDRLTALELILDWFARNRHLSGILPKLYEVVISEIAQQANSSGLVSSHKVKSRFERLMALLDFNLVEKLTNEKLKKQYFELTSPLAKRGESQKVLIYNWLPFDNPWNWGGGVTIYCRNILKELQKNRPDLDVYFLSSGFAYDGTTTDTFIREISSSVHGVRQFEIVNSPVPAEQRNLYVNPLVALENAGLKSIIGEFLSDHGPFAAIHLNNIEGLSLDVLDLKRDFPETRFVFSIHNYVPICVNGSYYMRHKHRICNPAHTGADCFACTRADIRSNLAEITYERGKFGQDSSFLLSKTRWINAFNFNQLDSDVSPDEILKFSQTATKKINENCDSILAVSQRVYDIAAENGFDQSKMVVSYIGTEVADRQMGELEQSAGAEDVKIVFLGSDIDFEEKGYAFLLDALAGLESAYARRIKLLLTVKTPEHAEIKRMLRKFKSVEVVQGYNHDDLSWIFDSASLSVVPVLWEDNLPQIAIESVAYGVPVLASSAGGAKELSDASEFVFKCGDAESFRDHLRRFVDNPSLGKKYWKGHHGLVTLASHIAELLGYYGIGPIMDVPSFTAAEYLLLERERSFLYEIISSRQLELSSEEFKRMEKQLKHFLAMRQVEEENAKEESMTEYRGKIVFQVDKPETSANNVGALLFALELAKFAFSDVHAEIHIVSLNNLSASFSCNVVVCATLIERDGEWTIEFHDIKWQGDCRIQDAIDIVASDNTISFVARHNGLHCGYSFDVRTLESRAEYDSVSVIPPVATFVYELVAPSAFGDVNE